MSAAAKKLAVAPASRENVERRHGPANLCRGLYEADIEDAEAIFAFRNRPSESWRTAQARWDEILGIGSDRRIPNDKFRYHWKRGCGCWPDDLRLR